MQPHPIDIIVPWVNPHDHIWVEQYNYWKEIERGEKTNERFRDMGTFKYWFRGIEFNCPWFNKIILVLASESQVPEWLNLDNDRLRIVYHNDFIPSTELPTFNSSVINCYMPFINELSENFVLFNDDIFVIKPTDSTAFFIDDHPVFTHKPRSSYGNSYWHTNLDNGKALLNKYLGTTRQFSNDHGPIAFKKSLMQFVWSKCEPELKSALSNTKFRLPKNFTDWVFLDFQANMKLCHHNGTKLTTYYNSFNAPFTPKTNIVCFNDTERISDMMFPNVVNEVTKYLNTTLGTKSSFER